jgi:hypothetical protein
VGREIGMKILVFGFNECCQAQKEAKNGINEVIK